MEKKLEKLESLLSKENLYNHDKKTFDDTINQINEIKKNYLLPKSDGLKYKF